MSPKEFSPDETRVSRIKAGLLFAIAIAPLFVATLIYYTGWGIPSATTNNGEFVEGRERIGDLGLEEPEGGAFSDRFMPSNQEAKWWILISARDCGTACRDWLDLTRRVHRRLHRDADRVRRAFVSGDATQPNSEAHPKLVQLRPPESGNPLVAKSRPSDVNGTVFVVDPMGNLVLRYDSRHNGTDLLEDIEHLLDSSPLG